MSRVEYSPEQVTRALLQLVANDGNVAKTAEDLIDDEFQVPESRLRSWKNDTHKEQYARLQLEHSKEIEAAVLNETLSTVKMVGELERDVAEKIGEKLGEGKIDARDLPATLRSLTDTKAKGIDRILSLTGRPRDPQGPNGNDLMQLLQGMADRGYLRLAVGVDMGQPAAGAPALRQQNADDGDDHAGDR